MPRQRKAQNGAVRAPLSTGRVAKTTTSTQKLQTVYRIPTGNRADCCNAVAYEVTGVSPIRVQIEGENIYRISLDTEALETLIENMDLDLSNVTLETINGDVTFTGSINAEWEFTWTVVNATTVNADAVNADDATIDNLTSTTSSLWTATADSLTTDDLTVNNDTSFAGDVTVSGTLSAATWTIDTLTSTDATITNLDATAGDITTLTSDAATIWQLTVTWTSDFAWDVTAVNIAASWNTTLNNLSTSWNTTLANVTVNGATTMTGNASVWGNLSVSGNSTVTGNQTITGDAIFSSDVSVAEDLTVSGDATITDDLTVNGSTHLNTFETTGSGSIGWNLSVDWSIGGWSSLVVENQIESGSIVTTNTVTDNLTVNGNIALWNDATAPDFVLQSEKGQANGVAPLNANGKVDPQYLPPVYTTAIVKVGTGIFSNSDTSVVVDSDITADTFVVLSNYSDIIGDLNEVINVGQLTVVSNQVETWSYKYIIVNPIS